MTETQRDNGTARSNRAAGPPNGVDRRRTPQRTRRAWTPREAVVKRLRQPVIGLTLAGVAVPILAATQTRPFGLTDSEDEQPAGPEHATAMTGEELEESIAAEIGVSEADVARESAIDDAMARHSIDRALAEDIHDAAVENNIDPKVAFGLVKTESTFRERAVSPVGARGLTQVMPRTAAWLQPGTSANDLFDRQTNLQLGFRYLDQLIDKYRGNIRLALLAYNRGPGTVDRVLKQGGNPDNGYADKVLRG